MPSGRPAKGATVEKQIHISANLNERLHLLKFAWPKGQKDCDMIVAILEEYFLQPRVIRALQKGMNKVIMAEGEHYTPSYGEPRPTGE